MTNQLTYLSQMDLIIVLRDGQISESGTLNELMSHHGAFADFVATYLADSEEGEVEEGGAE